MGVTLQGYGGVGEIGGNAFLLEGGGSRLFLDLGKRFGSDPRPGAARTPGWNDYYDDFLQPRGTTLAPDLMRLGIIPDLPTLWRQDRGGQAGASPVDGVLVSHAHMDHCGLLGLLRPDVPIWLSPGSRATLASLQETGGGVMAEYLEARPKGILPKKDGSPGKGTAWKDPETGDPVAATRPTDGGAVQVGDWDLKHFDVDHSIHGARATLLEGPLSVVYTGDFRMHGRDPDATKRFVERAGGVDVILAEGTRVRPPGDDHGHNNTDDESMVAAEMGAMLRAAGDRFVGVSFPPRDLDRFLSIWDVAREHGRRLVIPTKLAHLLDSVRGSGEPGLPDPRRDPHIAIHAPVRKKGVRAMPPGTLLMPDRDLAMHPVQVGDEEWSDFWLSDHETWERPYLTGDNTVTSADVAAAPHAYLFSISYWTISELFDLFPQTPGPRAGGLYIHSMTQPFNDEMEIGDRKLDRWLSAFNLERHDTHVSGHLSTEDLDWVLDEIGARTLVPIHSEAPHLSAERYQAKEGRGALLPEPGRTLHLG
ncbi:MAG: MBL fold metallo-hydrolase [Thermoplasmatota archaeon]